MDFVRTAGAGRWLGKTRPELTRMGSDERPPGGWGKSLMVKFDVSALVRPS